MKRRSLKATALWVFAVLHLVAAPALASIMVLCVGESGHVEIETSLRDLCCPPDVAPPAPAQLAPDASCTDTPLLRALGEPRGPERAGQVDLRSNALPAAFLAAPSEQLSGRVGRGALDGGEHSRAPFAALRSIVLIL